MLAKKGSAEQQVEAIVPSELDCVTTVGPDPRGHVQGALHCKLRTDLRFETNQVYINHLRVHTDTCQSDDLWVLVSILRRERKQNRKIPLDIIGSKGRYCFINFCFCYVCISTYVCVVVMAFSDTDWSIF